MMNRLLSCLCLCFGSFCLLLSCNETASQEAATTTPSHPEITVADPSETDRQKATKPFVDLDAVAFQNKMLEDNVVIIDVRKPGEIVNGKIEGALEMDITAPDFEEKMLALDKEKTYLMYCASGKRSLKACMMMSEKGFKQLYNLEGGYGAWQRIQELENQD